jgi:hypothetical protein
MAVFGAKTVRKRWFLLVFLCFLMRNLGFLLVFDWDLVQFETPNTTGNPPTGFSL